MHLRSQLIILVLVSLTFGNSLFNGFIGDDEVVIVKNNFYKDPKNIKRLFDKSYITDSNNLSDDRNRDNGSGSVAYRPVLSATYFLDYSLWKLNPLGYHLTNFLIHAANAILVYWLFFLLLQNIPQSLFGALVFALHPLKTEAVCSIGYRGDLLAAFFIIISFIAYVLSKKNPKLTFISLTCYFLALFSKESILGFILIFPLYDYFIEQRPVKELFRSNVKTYVGYLSLTLFYLYVYIFVFKNSSLASAHLMGATIVKHISCIFIIFSEYLLSFFVPFYVKTMPPLYQPAFNELWLYNVVVSFLLFLAVIAFCIWMARRKNITAFFLLWFIITLIPISNIIPIANPVAHRFMYLPSIGLAGWLTVIIMRSLKEIPLMRLNLKLDRIIPMGFLLACIFTTLPLNMAWKNPAVNAFMMIEDYPENPAGYFYMGKIFFEIGSFKKSQEMFSKSLELGLSDPRVYYYLGVLYRYDLNRSTYYFSEGLKRYPKFGLLCIGYGRNMLLSRNLDEAQYILEKAVELLPGYTAHGYLIQTLLLKGERNNAQDVLQWALAYVKDAKHMNSLKRFFEVDVSTLPVDIGI